jgi:hypothetical protein
MTSHPATRHLFLVLAIVGLLVPWRYHWLYFAGGGSLLPGPFFAAASANPLTTAITWDVYLAAAAFSVGVAGDTPMRASRWWAVPATFLIGLAFALPAYLWWRHGRGRASPA